MERVYLLNQLEPAGDQTSLRIVEGLDGLQIGRALCLFDQLADDFLHTGFRRLNGGVSAEKRLFLFGPLDAEFALGRPDGRGELQRGAGRIVAEHLRELVESCDPFVPIDIEAVEETFGAGFSPRRGGENGFPDEAVPGAECEKVIEIGIAIGGDDIDTAVQRAIVFDGDGIAAKFPHEEIRLCDIVANHGTCGDGRAVGDSAGTDETALTAEEDGILVQQDAMGDIADERCGCLVVVGRKVEMDIGGADFGVVFGRGSARHEDIAEINQRSEFHEWEKDCLLDADRMGDAGLFLQDATGACVEPVACFGFVQKAAAIEKTAADSDLCTDSAVAHCDGRFGTDDGVGSDGSGGAGDSAAGMDCRTGVDSFRIDVGRKEDGIGIGQDHAPIEESLGDSVHVGRAGRLFLGSRFSCFGVFFFLVSGKQSGDGADSACDCVHAIGCEIDASRRDTGDGVDGYRADGADEVADGVDGSGRDRFENFEKGLDGGDAAVLFADIGEFDSGKRDDGALSICNGQPAFGARKEKMSDGDFFRGGLFGGLFIGRFFFEWCEKCGKVAVQAFQFVGQNRIPDRHFIDDNRIGEKG